MAAGKRPLGCVAHRTREQGNAQRDHFLINIVHYKMGLTFRVMWIINHFWPQPDRLGSPLQQQMAVAKDMLRLASLPDNNFVLKRDYQTQFIDPMFMEPECFNGWFDSKTQTMHTIPSSQSPNNFFGFATSMLTKGPLAGKVKNLVVHSPFIGGGFGGKDHSILPYYGLLAVMYSDHPVRMANDRFEQFQAGLKRHPFTMTNQLAIDKTIR